MPEEYIYPHGSGSRQYGSLRWRLEPDVGVLGSPNRKLQERTPSGWADVEISTVTEPVGEAYGDIVAAPPTGIAAQDGPALDTATAAALTQGRRLILQPGSYTRSTTWVINGVPVILGPSYRYCEIVYSGTGNAMTINPPIGGQNVGCRLSGFKLRPSVVDGGTYGLEVALPSGGYFSNYEFSDLYIDDFGNRALRFNNDAGNANGFFTGTVRKCWLHNGISGSNMGDSLQFYDNTITGAGNFSGILFSGLPGARQMTIHDNNISTQGGALALIAVEEACIRNNQLEHPSYIGGYVGNYDTHCYFLNCHLLRFLENTVAPSAVVTKPSSAIVIDGGYGNLVRDNEITKGSTFHIGFNGGTEHQVGPNFYDQAVINSDLGGATVNGLRGVVIVPTLLNSWANAAGFVGAGYFKDPNGIVHLRGCVSGGSPATAAMFTLRVGYRPTSELRFSVPQVANAALLRVLADGTVQLGGSPSAATEVSLSGVTFLAA